MKTRILIDNQPDAKNALYAEHGLAMYLETDDDKHILIDTGLSGKFIDNANKMGIDLSRLDFCFISHGHNDHSGGLRNFVETFPDTKVYLSEHIFHEHYFTSRHGGQKELSTDKDMLMRYDDRFIPVEDSKWIDTDIAAVFCNCNEYPKPIGNIFLSKEADGTKSLDDFKHEMAMAVVTQEGVVVFSSCSHNGAINIMKSCMEYTGQRNVLAFIGGLHFVDCKQTEAEVKAFVNDINIAFPETKIYTGHCTCDKAKELLEASGLNISFFHTGDEISLA